MFISQNHCMIIDSFRLNDESIAKRNKKKKIYTYPLVTLLKSVIIFLLEGSALPTKQAHSCPLKQK